jgi:hypothetical protein
MPYGLPLSWSFAVALLLHSRLPDDCCKGLSALGKCYYNSTHIQDCLYCLIPRAVQAVYLFEAIAISMKHLRNNGKIVLLVTISILDSSFDMSMYKYLHL